MGRAHVRHIVCTGGNSEGNSVKICSSALICLSLFSLLRSHQIVSRLQSPREQSSKGVSRMGIYHMQPPRKRLF